MREALHQASAGFHVRRLINARFHPVSLPCIRSVSLEKLSPPTRGLGGPLHYRDPKQRSIDGYRRALLVVLCNRSTTLPMAFPVRRGDLINDAGSLRAIFR